MPVQAPQTGFQMQHFGAVLGHQDAALAVLACQTQQTQQQQEERQRQAAERHQLQQEREQEERAAAVLERLSDAQREAYRHRARGAPPGPHARYGWVCRHAHALPRRGGWARRLSRRAATTGVGEAGGDAGHGPRRATGRGAPQRLATAECSRTGLSYTA